MIDTVIKNALAEDLGSNGDITSKLTIPQNATAKVYMRSREDGVAGGLIVAIRTFEIMGLQVVANKVDGQQINDGDTLLTISGGAREVLSSERVALNFASHLSGIASATRKMVDAVAGTNARITCTRKTTPNLRALEKMAVVAGGGFSHRFGLGDAVLIKDNHIAIAGGIANVLERAKQGAGHMTKISIEVDNLEQLDEVLQHGGADVVMLDNMEIPDIKKAIGVIGGKLIVEYSGGVNLENVAAIAAAGVDYISCGWLTHSAPALDIGLDC